MNRMRATIILASTILLLASCTAKKTTSTQSAELSDEQKVAEVKKNFSEQQMEEGMSVYQGNCGKCHALPKAEAITVSKWERVLPRMTKKANLTEDQGAKVRAYVLSHAQI